MISKNIFARLIILACSIIVASGVLNAQSKNVVLIIQDDSLKTPIENVIVKIDKKNYQTDLSGKVSFSSDKSEVEIGIQKTSYQKKTLILKLTSDTNLVVDLKLSLTNLNEVSVIAEKENNFGVGHLNNIEGYSNLCW
jgi:uncharacterized membrane protein